MDIGSKIKNARTECGMTQEQSGMSDYVGYLKESSDVVKSREKHGKLVLIVVYLAIWIGMVVLYWANAQTDPDPFGFELVFLYMVMPIAEMVIAYQIGRNNFWKGGKWAIIPLFAVLHMELEGVTVGIDASLSRHEFCGIYFFNLALFGSGAVSAILGMLCGYQRYLREQRLSKDN